MRLAGWIQNYLCLTALAVGVPAIALGGPGPVAAHYHFGGGAWLRGDSNLVVFNKVFALPSTVRFQKLVAERAARSLARSLRLATNSAGASLLTPLLDDLMKTESLGDFDSSSGNPLSFVLAVRLNGTRAQLWQNNLSKAFGGVGEKFGTAQFNGLRWPKEGLPPFWMVTAQEWLLVGRGDDLWPVRDEYLQQIRQRGQPGSALGENWGEGEIDGMRLEGWPRLLKPARLKIQLSTKAGNLQIDARALYPRAVPWNSESWQLPKELIRTPLISFTAAQNPAAFLNQEPFFSRLDGNPLTNQFYAWALGQMPFQTYAAWPVANASNILEKLSKEASARFNPDLTNFNRTQLAWLQNNRMLILAGLRVMTPALEVAQDDHRPFLLMSMFPLLPRHDPAPAQLWQQIGGRTNLVYYDWELTGPRLQQWRLLGHILFDRRGAHSDDMFDATRIEDKWLGELVSALGSCVTEITQVSPQELSFVRNAPLGATGIEIFWFCAWLSGASFGP